MSGWADVASKALDFLQRPNALGVVVVMAFLGFLAYAVPMAVVTWTSWDNTNRLEKAITALGANCLHSTVASR